MHAAPIPPTQRTTNPISPEMEQLLLRCLDKEMNLRPPSAGSIARESAGHARRGGLDAGSAAGLVGRLRAACPRAPTPKPCPIPPSPCPP